jgi:hypothetical protein
MSNEYGSETLLETIYNIFKVRDYVNADPGPKTHYVPPDAQRKPRVIVRCAFKYLSDRLLLVALRHLWQLWTHLMNYYVRGGDNFVDVSPNYIHRFRQRKKKKISLSHVPLKNEHSSCRYYSLLVRYINPHILLVISA